LGLISIEFSGGVKVFLNYFLFLTTDGHGLTRIFLFVFVCGEVVSFRVWFGGALGVSQVVGAGW
jgi:hypothetical protein